MSDLDARLRPIARARRNLITRADVLACGGTDDQIRSRLRRGLWQQVFPGVYLVGPAPPDWHQRLHAAVLAGGERAMTGGPAAVVLWGLDGVASAPPSVLVPHDVRRELPGVAMQRTRRIPVPVRRHGIPVTDVKRTLLDAAACLPRISVIKAFESACRAGLVTPAGMRREVAGAHRGVEGVDVLRSYLATRGDGRAAGSGAEVEVIEALVAAGIEPPKRQFEIPLGNGDVAVVDLAWPWRRKAVEVYGFDAHSAPIDIERDAERANAIQNAGWQLRIFGGRTARHRPARIAAEIQRFLSLP